MLNAADRAANTQLGKRIAALRAVRGMSQEALAAALKTSKSMMHKYETGSAIIPAVILKRIADALGVSIEELLGGDGKTELLPTMTAAVGRLVHEIMSLDELVRESVVVTAVTHIEQIKKIRRIRAGKR
jgi:transcriptional regulator with XRE-family HTH domain